MRIRTFILTILFIALYTIPAVAQSPSDSILTQKLSCFGQRSKQVNIDSAKIFIEDKLDFASIENTTSWRQTIKYWITLYSTSEVSGDSFAKEFTPAAKKVIAKIKEKYPSTALHLSKELIDLLPMNVSDNVAASIVAYANLGIDVPGDEYSEIAHRILTSEQLITGRKAPSINGIEDECLKNSIIIFYDRNCNMCTWQIEQMIDKYELIRAKGYDVISIAADTSKESFEEYSKQFPWKNKVCDLKGMNSDNLKHYGIISMPMVYITDENGMIVKKYPKFDQIELFYN